MVARVRRYERRIVDEGIVADHEVPRRPAVYHVPLDEARVLPLQLSEAEPHLGLRRVAGPYTSSGLQILLALRVLVQFAAADWAPLRVMLPDGLCYVIEDGRIMSYSYVLRGKNLDRLVPARLDVPHGGMCDSRRARRPGWRLAYHRCLSYAYGATSGGAAVNEKPITLSFPSTSDG